MSGYGLDGSESQDEGVRVKGRVKWFDPAKGYGFIVPDEPGETGLKDVLLHVTSLRQSGRESALEGALIWASRRWKRRAQQCAPPQASISTRNDGGGTAGS